MISNDDFIARKLHQKIASHLKAGAIELLNDNDILAIDHHFTNMGFPRRVEEILWENVPNSEHYVVKIPTKKEESRDFTTRITEKYDLKGSVILYGDYFMAEEYRMDISFLPEVIWDFIGVPICLYAVNTEDNWCFSYHSLRQLNFGFAPKTASRQ